MNLWQPGRTLDEIEKEIILTALKYYQGNKTKTSQSLGIAIRTLDNKLLKYEAKEPEVAKHVATPLSPAKTQDPTTSQNRRR
jgi:DNA-binding NtrC family response regulator